MAKLCAWMTSPRYELIDQWWVRVGEEPEPEWEGVSGHDTLEEAQAARDALGPARGRYKIIDWQDHGQEVEE